MFQQRHFEAIAQEKRESVGNGRRKRYGGRLTWKKNDDWKNDPGEQAADRWNETHGDRW